MRFKRTAAVLGSALVSLAALSGCAGDSWGEEAGLPAAGDLAAVEKLVSAHTMCSDLRRSSEGPLAEQAADPAWAVRERAVCGDDSKDTVTLLSIADMEKFQQANKTAAAHGRGVRVLLGRDFALAPADEATARALLKADVLLFTCEKDFRVPDGYRKEKLLVEGCALTDYLPG
ncbi:hypothetical protein ABZV60_08565 [Streptomyces sp. NPDC004787]|uniref:hypothetical protein n=1 Tax=Streptomyces sp. NPDC004787 TaxID=3154291 RepID=UPI0033A14250